MPGSETFYEILARRAAAHPEREAIVDHRHRVTYGELLERVDRTAAALQSMGLGRGDVVTIQLPNWVEFAYVFFACERLGAIANQIGPDFRSREVEYIVRFSQSRAFVCPATFKGFDYVAMVRSLRPTLTGLKAVLVLRGGDAGSVALDAGTFSLDDLIYGATPPPPLKPYRMAPDAIMRMAFTSGTTGNPKGVTHSFETTLPAAEILNGAMGVTEREVFLIYLLGLPDAAAVDHGRRARRAARSLQRPRGARADRPRARDVHPQRAGVHHRHAERSRAGALRLAVAARRHHRRRLVPRRDDPRVPPAHPLPADRALRHAGDRLSHLHALR
jgi:acyl-CoA synthetase (AMP-forming)/AMP-acid ligase II